MDLFSPATRHWFRQAFAGPTPVQARGWETVARGEHALLVAPTGSGKTLAAFLWGLDRVTALPPDAPPGVRVLYISPLKALAYDVERNLRTPLAGIRQAAAGLGAEYRAPGVAIRTGDTPQAERRRQLKRPGEILVTTPESLFLLLGSAARETLRTVHTIIVDEVHALAAVKRGAHLALSLERLAELCARDPQRIGLSATVRPAATVAAFLGGERPVTVVDAAERPHLDLTVRVPAPDMENVTPAPERRRGGNAPGAMFAGGSGAAPSERGIWSALYPELLEQIRGHRTTLIFVNSRGLCERLAQRLNDLAGEALVAAHHGSLSHARRAAIEEDLKAGRVRGIVATSSLELGIDMGTVDRVLLVESPGAVSRGLQRVGRAGHGVGEVSAGTLYPKFRGDLLECAVVAGRMLSGEIEALRMPDNPLDVLAQQVAAICVERPRARADIAALVRRARPWRRLSDAALEAVLDMLSGRYPGDEFAELVPLLAWDRERDELRARRGAALRVRLNAGTIPDRGLYGVFLAPDGPRVGELDEEMIFESRTGDVILLGASSWRIEAIERDRVLVSPAPGEPGRLPFWHGEGPGRPLELGRALGAFVRELGRHRGRDAAVRWLRAQTPLEAYAAGNLADYILEQRERTGTLPTDRAVTIERFRDELGDWRVCILTPFGARLHAPWALAIQQRLSERGGFDVQVLYTDDGIALRLADTETPPDPEWLLPDPEEVEELVTRQLADSALFAGLFRENAARSLLLARNRPDRRTPLWAQRLRARQLLAVVRRYPAFPVVLETYRQCLADVFDMPGLRALLGRIRSREVRVDEVETASASPFARSLVFAYVAAYLYEQDAPLAERKAQALTLDRNLLAELIGQAELRELLDADVLAELEAELQHLPEARRARDADALHDVLRHLGDLDAAELAGRCAGDPAPWLEQLTGERRAAEIQLAGRMRWIAAEDAGLYRDALGVAPPAGLPDTFLATPERPLERLLARFARTHGPFTAAAAADRYGQPPGLLEPALQALAAEGRLVRGELRPGGSEPEWCDAEVLCRIKRRTLARLRNAVAPVEARTLGRFLPAWQGLDDPAAGADALERVVARLEGLALPWTVLGGAVLPARVPGFVPEQLDLLAASGRVVWVGRGPLGPTDGRIALYRRERAPLLLPAPEDYAPPGVAHAVILEQLVARGACFLSVLEQAVQQAHPDIDGNEFRAALWDLVWAGRITNDTFAPLRGLGVRTPRAPRRRGIDPLAGGRWWRVDELRDAGISDTERRLVRAHALLERYGVVSREAAEAESVPGGFGALYPVLKRLEESGRIRRGWFVEGLSGAQFALSGAVDRLRAARGEETGAGPSMAAVRVLAAADPANPWGALLPWPAPAHPEARPRRVPGAWVVLVGGWPVFWLGPRGRRLWSFPDPVSDDPEAALAAACRALGRLPRTTGGRGLVIERIDGEPAHASPLAPLLRTCGFESDYKGLTPGPVASDL